MVGAIYPKKGVKIGRAVFIPYCMGDPFIVLCSGILILSWGIRCW